MRKNITFLSILLDLFLYILFRILMGKITKNGHFECMDITEWNFNLLQKD